MLSQEAVDNLNAARESAAGGKPFKKFTPKAVLQLVGEVSKSRLALDLARAALVLEHLDAIREFIQGHKK